ncbi:DUF1801 domain-containing protein [Fictibacillus fluitans]|uniref:DUF1801 domain-containing protein n=1 Tax=Fictibacillus fluitans TaxID=3058422 RepID=A0ABT8HYM7_9BACL|nr:DUF1801 domain-containing protein [Fictibacillus sp. NE201]MDN4525884.1 DUF1801 domain-containing protein [Fictibacillus sp. NE201]
MNSEVTVFIEKLDKPWKIEIASQLRSMVHSTIPDVEERIQYKKPHFLKNGKYTAVITPSKDAVAFMIFNTADLELPEGKFEGPPERKWIKFRDGDTPDYEALAQLLTQASAAQV